jgi:hypothetical protein
MIVQKHSVFSSKKTFSFSIVLVRVILWLSVQVLLFMNVHAFLPFCLRFCLLNHLHLYKCFLGWRAERP